MDGQKIIIVGAGPVGLSAALFLADLGHHPRIIERRKDISIYSKALALNPNTLQLFEKSGVTERFLKNGIRVSKMNIWSGHQWLYRNDFSKEKIKYPFMLVQPQYETEQILAEELRKRDIIVEREINCTGIKSNVNEVHISLEHEDG